jgi:Sec-independent protein translocase protein TatA
MFDVKRIGQDALPKAIGHMGTHIADFRDARAQRTDEAEARAWQVTLSQ